MLNLNNSLDSIDPTTLAISLIPLLPSDLSVPSSTSSINLPLLAASLSTLPPNVINAINLLTQELKALREKNFLESTTQDSSFTTNQTDDKAHSKETRERWLEDQKVNHLKKSISSLTNLHSTLQSRLLTTVDTLSNLQQIHQRETQQLADERDGVRAVNKVLKRKIIHLENQLSQSKDVMESVLERVNVVNAGDWSIVQHGVIQVHQPIPSTPSFDTLGHDQRTHFSQQSHSNQLKEDQSVPPPHLLDYSSKTFQNDPQNLTQDSRQNPRSLTLIVELTEELETLREEIKVELKSKQDEIDTLKSLINYRDDEIKQLMGRLEHFMGLDGFYVHSNEHERSERELDHNLGRPKGDLEITPRQKHTHQINSRQNILPTRSSSFNKTARTAITSPLDQQRLLQDEIKQLESQLKEAIRNPSQNLIPDSSSRTVVNQSCSFDLDSSQSDKSTTDDTSYLNSGNSSDNRALSRAIADLSNQVVDLKSALKEVSDERDVLKRLRSRKKRSSPSSSSSQPDSEQKEATNELRDALNRSQFESNRLNRLLAQSESRVLRLEKQIAEQEAEFEQVAERVQDKLQDQRSKLIQAKTQIEKLQAELDQAKSIEQTLKQKLIDERKRADALENLVNQKSNSLISRDKERSTNRAGSSSSSSSSRRTPKEPFSVGSLISKDKERSTNRATSSSSNSHHIPQEPFSASSNAKDKN
ncbi:hypothetical protein O181_053446 [Austropuccinia psidii MF-1]|uniref:Uncharacterized protein n=1 Tax=Austropuccinia psidii MF-1 TaxID=1389203 RepID=A0A9Q3HQ79_9BASI|nr:hypothetical protein [Austropuccinia psidii MF-1]